MVCFLHVSAEELTASNNLSAIGIARHNPSDVGLSIPHELHSASGLFCALWKRNEKDWATVRGRAAPRNLLAVREESLAIFLQRVGLVLYDTDWKHEFAYVAPPLEETRIGSTEEMSALVREQIIAGIIGGKVDVRPLFSPSGLRERKVEEPPEPEGRRVPRPAADEDDAEDREPNWRIRSSLWTENPQIDWRESTLEIDGTGIVDTHSNRSLADLYETPPHPIVAHLRVHDPDSSIRSMISFDELPDEKWFKKYNDYVGSILREAIAVAWRHAAVDGIGSEETVNQNLSNAISKYFEANDEVISEETVKNVVGKMVKQWKSHNMFGRIFVNSSRDKRRLHGKGNAAVPDRKT